MLQDASTTTAHPWPFGYSGPERRTLALAPPMTGWLARMLDEIDHGMLLVTPAGVLRHANLPARGELAGASALRLSGEEVRAAQLEQHHRLLQALAEAARGRRSLLTLGAASAPLPVAALPLGCKGQGEHGLVLLMLGKRQPCASLTVDFYARHHGLTGAEARVLQAVCNGLRPKEVARAFDVAVSTVRTQISSIRAKTQTASIRELVNRVSALPPIVSLMQSALPH